MSKVITNFGDSTTTGNTTLQQNLTVQGAFSTFSGNILAGSASSTFGNSTNKFNSVFAATANIPSVNVTGIFGTTGFVGINTNPASAGANLQVDGNVWASNALSAPLVVATISLNVVGTTNTSAIYGISGSVGIGAIGTGATLNVVGNAYVSNSLSAPSVFALTSMNTPTTNTLSFYGPSGFVGIGTSGAGSTLNVAGNVWASNALTSRNIFATVSMNVVSGAVLNTASIFGTSGSVGIGGVGTGATLNVTGNVWISNALATPNIFATTANITTLNVSSLSGTNGTVGIGTNATGPAFFVAGNLYASNAVTAPSCFVTTMNITSVLNTQSIFSSTGRIGIGTTTTGANLHVLGNLYASNALTAPVVRATISMNITTLNTTSIFGTSGQVGIGTTQPTATLQVQGNLYATNAISTTNILATTLNTTVINTASIFGPSGLVGVGGTPIGSTLDVIGNLYASNALTSPNIVSDTSNITILNTTSIYTKSSSIGINTTVAGATLQIGGNLYASNALTGPNLFATGTIYYGEDLVKRSPYLVPNVANSTIIQSWISATCNAADQVGSFWGMSGQPVYGNAASGPIGSSDYSGSVLLPDGRVLFVPSNASNVGMFNPSTGLFSTITISGLSTATGKFFGGVLLPNGNVVFVPRQSANIGMFNPVSYTYSNAVTIAGPSGTLFAGGALAPNGNVIFAPASSGNVGVYNPTLGTYSNVGPNGTVATAFAGAVLLPTGNVVFVPASSTNIGMFNTYSMATSSYINIGPFTPTGFSGGVLAPNGNVVFIPSTGTSVGVYNPTLRTYSSIAIGNPTNGFNGGCLSPTGNVVFAPYAAANIGLFDPIARTYSNVFQAASGTTKFSGATQLPDGRVVLCPFGSTNVGVINTMVPVAPEFCLAPYFNKY